MSRLTYDIILDFDDVIYPFGKGIEAVMKAEGIPGRITQWACEKDYGMEREEFWRLITQPRNHDLLYRQPIHYEVIRHLRRLHHAGNRIHVVTARVHPESMALAREVVRRENIPLKSLHFEKDKGPMVDDLNASFSLDDAPHNYLALDQRNHQAFLMSAFHNHEFFAPRRVDSVGAFVDIVLGFQRAGVQVRGDQK